MKKYLLCTIMLFTAFLVQAQNNQKPCSAAESGQFDFWVGDWVLYSADTVTGSNSIYKIMDGCTVQENFSNPKTGYQGKSWSVYNPQRKKWDQTWVDNQGGYIPLSGSFENGKMTLVTPPFKNAKGVEMMSRMVYYNITKNSFDWSWEASSDGGANWKPSWQIHYVRK